MHELVEFYERYLVAFNAQDREAFAGFFHLPVTVVPAARYDERRAGRPFPVIDDVERLWAPVPGDWARSTLDALVPLDDADPFAPRAGLTEAGPRRPALLATVTRWRTDGQPYEQLHVLYLLTRQSGRLGISAMVELAVARLDGAAAP